MAMVHADDVLQERLYDMFLTALERNRLSDAKELYQALHCKTKPDNELRRRMKVALTTMIDNMEMDDVFSLVAVHSRNSEESLYYQELYSIFH